MKKLITSVMASAMLLCVSSAQAWCEPDCSYDPCAPCAPCDPCCYNEGFYIGGFGGANFLTFDKKYRHFDGSRSRSRTNTGYVAAASIGYRWCNNFRAEFEYAYRFNKLKGHHHKHHDVTSSQEYRSHGKNEAYSNAYLFNLVYDIAWCNDWCIKPYIGAGIGYAQHHVRLRSHNVIVVGGPEIAYKARSKNNGFAWQVLAGLAYPICDNLDLSIEYRFFKGNLKHLYNQNVGAGLRYYF